jgi:uncharacterized protein (TIGR02058 family)
MTYKRYIVELGSGVDLHGGDVTKATIKAIKDAVSHCCLCGITEILEIKDPRKMEVKIKVGCPHPEKLNLNEVLQAVPLGNASIDEVVEGGFHTTGLHVGSLGEGDQIVVSVVSLTVYLNI